MEIINQYGKIKRYRGGFWAQEGSPMKAPYALEPTFYIPVVFASTTTVEALHRRGLIEPSYWRNLPSGMFITEYKLTEKDAEQIDKDGQTA